jgi:hypothetical protein
MISNGSHTGNVIKAPIAIPTRAASEEPPPTPLMPHAWTFAAAKRRRRVAKVKRVSLESIIFFFRFDFLRRNFEHLLENLVNHKICLRRNIFRFFVHFCLSRDHIKLIFFRVCAKMEETYG